MAKLTRQVKAGNVLIGGGAPVSVQSMTNTDTADVEATLSQIRALAIAGADIVRVSVYNEACAKAVRALVDGSPVPLVADMSSGILSKPINVSDYALIYAGAQKNMAPAGMTLVIIREDLIGDAMACCPDMLRYKVHAENGSMYNTPPCYTIYVAGLVYQWLLELGGLEVMQKINEKKAGILYDYLDNSKLFIPVADKAARSDMNVTFRTGDEELDAKFIKAATEAGFVNLKGHRKTGGMRASIYNAMPMEGVEKLAEFMQQFEKNN